MVPEEDPQKLAERYRNRGFDDLMGDARSYDELVEPAKIAIREEFRRRGLDMPEPRKSGGFAEMSNGALMRVAVGYDALPEAQQASLRAEFAARRLEPPLVEDAEAEGKTAPDLSDPKLVTVARYRDLTAALVARAVLEGQGIQCFLFDENFVRLDWGYSNFIGGMRLQVSDSDSEFANSLLTGKAPETIEVPGEALFVQPICPRCGSDDVVAYDPGLKLAAASVLFIGVPTRLTANRSSLESWHCMNCGCNWSDDDDSVVGSHPQ